MEEGHKGEKRKESETVKSHESLSLQRGVSWYARGSITQGSKLLASESYPGREDTVQSEVGVEKDFLHGAAFLKEEWTRLSSWKNERLGK